jgi:hypothetical protein
MTKKAKKLQKCKGKMHFEIGRVNEPLGKRVLTMISF